MSKGSVLLAFLAGAGITYYLDSVELAPEQQGPPEQPEAVVQDTGTTTDPETSSDGALSTEFSRSERDNNTRYRCRNLADIPELTGESSCGDSGKNADEPARETTDQPGSGDAKRKIYRRDLGDPSRL